MAYLTLAIATPLSIDIPELLTQSMSGMLQTLSSVLVGIEGAMSSRATQEAKSTGLRSMGAALSQIVVTFLSPFIRICLSAALLR